MDPNGVGGRRPETLAAGHTDSYVDCPGRVGCSVHHTSYTIVSNPFATLNLRYHRRHRYCDVSSRVHMVVVSTLRRRWICRCRSLQLLAVSVLLTLLQCPPLLDRVVPVLLVYALMPPVAAANDRRCTITGADEAATVVGGSRVRETKKVLLDRSNGASTSSGGICSRSSRFVVKGTVSKITEKFQTQPVLPPRTTRIPKLLQHWSSVAYDSLPPMTTLQSPPPVIVKYEIKRRQEKLLGELHRHHRRSDDQTSSFSYNGPSINESIRDSATSSDCGSCSSDSEKSVCCSGSTVEDPTVTAVDEKPGSPHSSGYESVEETAVTVELAQTSPPLSVPYSWVFGDSEHDGSDGFADYAVVSSPSSSSDNSMIAAATEDRLERLVTFASTASYPALTSAKSDQDGRSDDDIPPAEVRRHFVRNDVATPIAVPAGCLSPIPEYLSTEPNSVETVEDCSGDDDNKVSIISESNNIPG